MELQTGAPWGGQDEGSMAHSFFWWLGMDSQIKDKTKDC